GSARDCVRTPRRKACRRTVDRSCPQPRRTRATMQGCGAVRGSGRMLTIISRGLFLDSSHGKNERRAPRGLRGRARRADWRAGGTFARESRLFRGRRAWVRDTVRLAVAAVTAPGNHAGDGSDAAARADARSAGLRHVSDTQPGIRRLRSGKGFRYVDAAGARVGDADTLRRIASLAIPPAYVKVWICAHANGHLQATGVDARGRKQYRYHPRWRVVRDGGKFDRMIAFGAALPALRRRLRRDLALPGLPRDKVLALVVSLLDSTLARVGNSEYARDNKSYGLTTLRTRHVRAAGAGRLRLDFRGKGGTVHDIVVDDRRLVRIVRRCQQLPGQ